MKIRFGISAIAFELFAIAIADTSILAEPIEINVDYDGDPVVSSIVLTGSKNSTLSPVTNLTNGTKVSYSSTKPQVIKVDVKSNQPFIGAQFTVFEDDSFYGVWSYPFSGQLFNNHTFELLGVGNAEGINWCNARAAFFISTAGYGVYVDTLSMGSFNFSTSGLGTFVFNTSSLSYYIILPKPGEENIYKSILQEYTSLSAKIEIPPDSAYGPNLWSDNSEQDFHGSVSNAQENYYDIINHLYENKIRATSTFADRPYGTGNWSFGNFDFDPKYYPNPVGFINNLTSQGFDFQVWVANRAFLYTELYNVSVANNWLFPGIDGKIFLGPALNLSIPAAYNYLKNKLKVFPEMGVRGFKIDRGEEAEMPDWEQNIQMDLFIKMCYDIMVEKWGVSNYYTFARSAVDRSRGQTGIWNGDAAANWTGLQYSVASGIRAGIMGYSMWGSDTGGYTRGANDPSEDLWGRWMWFSALSPVYEIMVGTGHTPWYAPYTSRLVNVLKASADLHTALIPYIRSYTYQASKTGLPLMRAMFLEYPDEEEKFRGVADQYMFGSELMAAPIVKDSVLRTVYFPGKYKWLEYMTKTTRRQVYRGGRVIHNITASLEEGGPVYVKEGAIIPTGDLLQGNYKWASWKPSLVFEVFPSYDVRKSSFDYWSKEGNRSVAIDMAVYGRTGSGTVTLSYGSFGTGNITISLWVYVAGAVQKVAMNGSNGTVSVRMERSIWQ